MPAAVEIQVVHDAKELHGTALGVAEQASYYRSSHEGQILAARTQWWSSSHSLDDCPAAPAMLVGPDILSLPRPADVERWKESLAQADAWRLLTIQAGMRVKTA